MWGSDLPQRFCCSDRGAEQSHCLATGKWPKMRRTIQNLAET